jgi:hypothetical protein
MSKLTDFYQKAHTDSGIKAELSEVSTTYVAGVIATATKRGVMLAAAAPPIYLDDDALAGVAGGDRRAESLLNGLHKSAFSGFSSYLINWDRFLFL